MSEPGLRLPEPMGFRGVFRADESARAVYSEAAGIGRAMPAAVAVPHDAADIAAVIGLAREHGSFVMPRGSGSSMAGGAIGQGIALDTSRLREMGAVDRKNRCVKVGV